MSCRQLRPQPFLSVGHWQRTHQAVSASNRSPRCAWTDTLRAHARSASSRPVLTRALPKIPYPDHCRTSPDDHRDLSYWLAGEDGVQDKGNGDQRKRYRTDQGGCAPAQAREIEKPEEHRQVPVNAASQGASRTIGETIWPWE